MRARTTTDVSLPFPPYARVYTQYTPAIHLFSSSPPFVFIPACTSARLRAYMGEGGWRGWWNAMVTRRMKSEEHVFPRVTQGQLDSRPFKRDYRPTTIVARCASLPIFLSIWVFCFFFFSFCKDFFPFSEDFDGWMDGFCLISLRGCFHHIFHGRSFDSSGEFRLLDTGFFFGRSSFKKHWFVVWKFLFRR